MPTLGVPCLSTNCLCANFQLVHPQEAIRSNLCKLLKADPSVVNVKAKTHEKVCVLAKCVCVCCPIIM